MFTLANALPWYFWALWGVVGSLYIFWWVIKSTRNDPILCRIGWVLMGIFVVTMVIDNLIRGTGVYIKYWSTLMDWMVIPLVIIWALIFIGGYQKSQKPGFDPEKRRTVALCMYGIVIILICMGFIFGGFYIYDIFLAE